MFTPRARIQLKLNSFIEFSQKIQNRIMLALQLQKGFCDGVTSIDTIWLTAIEDTRWETKADAEIYQRTGYPEILKVLYGMIDSEPVRLIFEVPDPGSNRSSKPADHLFV